jgi:signal transduction histidine kinase
VEDKLDYAKLESGKTALRLGPVVLAELLRQCAEDQAAAAREKGVEMSVQARPGLSVRADEWLLSRVVQNLLDNALKFTPAGGSVALRAEPADGTVLLRVIDSGPGVPPESLPHLFDPYYQAAQRRAGKTRGTGLGLAFCRLALKAMGGNIRVTSPAGQGCEFAVRLSTN